MPLKDLTNRGTSPDFSIDDFERMFLGAIIGGLIDSDEILKVKRDYFTSAQSQDVYTIILKFVEQRSWVDYLSVLTELSRHKVSTDAKTILETYLSKVPVEFNPQKAVQILEEAFIRRKTLDIIQTASIKIQQTPYAANEIIHSAAELADKLLETKVDFDIGAEFEKTASDLILGKAPSFIIPTGIDAIDRHIGGLSTQEVTIIGARPAHGKTTSSVALLLSIIRKNPQAKGVLFQLEMGMEQIKRKFLASLSGVSTMRMRLNQITEADHEPLRKAAEKLKEYAGRLFIYDNVFDLLSMNKICRAINANVAIVDFIKFMDEARGDVNREALGEIVRDAKRFAKAHNMNYLFYSQLNRGQEARETHRPQMSDLAESDLLTQFASEIMLLLRPVMYTNKPEDKNKLIVILDKSRYSDTGDIKLYMDPDLVVLKGW